MKTESIAVQSLCIPCANRCRYCLLSWNGKLRGADYDRSERYAQRFYDWLKQNRPDVSFQFYFGYSMEHPRLLKAIDFMRSIGSTGGEFLQFDGMNFRSGSEIDALLTDLKEHGIQAIDLTFYGLRDYHDRFAVRSGDFDFMMEILSRASRIGLQVMADIPLNQENAHQADELIDQLSKFPLKRISLFVPHAEGRGASLDKVRLTLSDYEQLSDRAKSFFNRSRFRTEREWIVENALPRYENRFIGISLTPDNIDALENQSFEETIASIEALDDGYHAALPDLDQLTQCFGDPESNALYNSRDLIQGWQRRYIAEHQLNLYDIHDERQHFIRRY